MNRYEIILGCELPQSCSTKIAKQPAVKKQYFYGIDIGYRNAETAFAICHKNKEIIVFDYAEVKSVNTGGMDFEGIWISQLNKKYPIADGIAKFPGGCWPITNSKGKERAGVLNRM